MKGILNRLRLFIIRLLGGEPSPAPARREGPAPEVIQLSLAVGYDKIINHDSLGVYAYMEKKLAKQLARSIIRGKYMEVWVTDRPESAQRLYCCKAYLIRPPVKREGKK